MNDADTMTRIDRLTGAMRAVPQPDRRDRKGRPKCAPVFLVTSARLAADGGEIEVLARRDDVAKCHRFGLDGCPLGRVPKYVARTVAAAWARCGPPADLGK